MRIITGDYKGRRLFMTTGRHIRPTSDNVKEAMFSMIAPYLNGTIVVDLFSGTGNLGLEALSRGAGFAYFGDRSKESIALTIKNIELCKAKDRTTVLMGDWKQVLRRIDRAADIIFLDPPYDEIQITDVLLEIEKLSSLSPSGIVVAEHGLKQMLPDRIACFIKQKEKEYGIKRVTIYTMKTEDN